METLSMIEKLQEVEKRLKHEKSRRMYERYQTVRLHLLGKDNAEIAISIGPGPPEQLIQEQQEQLKKTILDSLPHEVGFTAKFNWTLHIIGEYIKREFGKSYSIRGVSKLMHRMELSYTKPTYTLAAADEEKQREFVETTFPRLKKLRERRN
jgi:transposase